MKGMRFITAVTLAVLAASPVIGAALTNESFDAGANGWIGTSDFGFWTFPAGEARTTFLSQTNLLIPFPASAVLSNAPFAASGSFTGDFTAAAVSSIGFTFLAPDLLPSPTNFPNVILRWGGSTSVFQRAFSVTETGVWYRFEGSLRDGAKDEWNKLSGSMDDFSAARESVSFISIRCTRSGLDEIDYVIGEVYLVNQPESEGLTQAGTSLVFRAGSLISGELYDVESAPEVTGTWSAVQSFTATNVLQTIPVTNSEPRRFLRLMRQ